ncbi:hypothetical protein BJ742DRAFT_408396 [Cladochytrium replicatum]|nr:hypothetical protein BJ742DRAFT_408396 [Cladochytrium replicatum]
MSSHNRMIDKSSLCHPFPQSRHPFMMTIPTAAAEALGMAVETSAPSVALKSCWELLVLLADMMSTFILQSPIPATQCQLVTRHWNIRYKSGATQVVEGEGVVGQFPIFNVSNPFFEYCSSCPDEIDDPCVWMEGKFTFVPGSIQTPSGPPFEVVVPRFVFPTALEFAVTAIRILSIFLSLIINFF